MTTLCNGVGQTGPKVNVSDIDVNLFPNIDASAMGAEEPDYLRIGHYDQTQTHEATYNVLSRNIVPNQGNTLPIYNW